MDACETITNAALDLLVQKCAGLDLISLRNGMSFDPYRRFSCTDTSIKSIATHCPELTPIHIGGNIVKMKDASLIALSTGCARLRHTGLVRRCYRITDVAIEVIVSQCPNLSDIILEGSNVTNRGLAALARGCQRLLVANVSRCNLVTDAGVIALVRLHWVDAIESDRPTHQ